MCSYRRLGRARGFILISALGIIMVLAVFVWSIGRRSLSEIAYMDHAQGMVNSYAAARAGVYYMLDVLNRTPSLKDSLYATGIQLPSGKKPPDLLGRIAVGKETYAVVGYAPFQYAPKGNPALVNGVQDEGGKINLNAINDANKGILSALFQLKGISRQAADALAARIVLYRSSADMPGSGEGAFHLADQEDGLRPKQRPFEHVEELLEVQGMSRELYDKIKDDVTVYGQAQNGLNVNLNTANNEVLRALFNAVKQENPGADVESLMRQAIAYRDGSDGFSFTEDDAAADPVAASNYWPPALQPNKASDLRVQVQGVDVPSGVTSRITAVIECNAGFGACQIIGWQRD